MNSKLLEVDGIGNVLLGLPLILFPRAVLQFLGLSATGGTLFPVILGSIFIGIGIALLVQRFKPTVGGLGLGGAMSINLVFGVVLAGWLVVAGSDLLFRGALLLWALVLALVGIGLAEVFSMSRRASA